MAMSFYMPVWQLLGIVVVVVIVVDDDVVIRLSVRA